MKLKAGFNKDSVFKKEKSVKWRCRNCGYVHEGESVSNEYSACDHPRAYYELLCENH
ncbi:MAG: rubredoxin-like domain-containing protein [Elusimicrobiota bacterium]